MQFLQSQGREAMNKETDERTPNVKPAPSPAPAPAGGKTGIRKTLDVFAAALGIGPSRTRKPAAGATDTGTLLAHERTDLAMDRTYWAAERTLMGWIRTAISMISFGFTIGKVGQALGEVEVRGFRGMRMIGVDSIAYLLVILGTVALLAAAVQHSRRVHELCEQGLRRQPSIAFAVALVLSVLGIVAFSSLVLKI
jgi:putative membrane protein